MRTACSNVRTTGGAGGATGPARSSRRSPARTRARRCGPPGGGALRARLDLARRSCLWPRPRSPESEAPTEDWDFAAGHVVRRRLRPPFDHRELPRFEPLRVRASRHVRRREPCGPRVRRRARGLAALVDDRSRVRRGVGDGRPAAVVEVPVRGDGRAGPDDRAHVAPLPLRGALVRLRVHGAPGWGASGRPGGGPLEPRIPGAARVLVRRRERRVPSPVRWLADQVAIEAKVPSRRTCRSWSGSIPRGPPRPRRSDPRACGSVLDCLPQAVRRAGRRAVRFDSRPEQEASLRRLSTIGRRGGPRGCRGRARSSGTMSGDEMRPALQAP